MEIDQLLSSNVLVSTPYERPSSFCQFTNAESMKLTQVLLQMTFCLADNTRHAPGPMPSLPNIKKRRVRRRINAKQLVVLEEVFATTRTPNRNLRTQLAEQLGMDPRRVQIWFQNKRARSKTKVEKIPNSPIVTPGEDDAL